jgi:hypothetical protein
MTETTTTDRALADDRVLAIMEDMLERLQAITGLRGEAYRVAGLRAFLAAHDRAVEHHGEEEGTHLARMAAGQLGPMLTTALGMLPSRRAGA